jgi:hypothetical protein
MEQSHMYFVTTPAPKHRRCKSTIWFSFNLQRKKKSGFYRYITKHYTYTKYSLLMVTGNLLGQHECEGVADLLMLITLFSPQLL